MANLFVVFTPLQLIVAQQIIRQENLSDNIMLESSIGKFSEIYNLIRDDISWKKVLLFENWANWDESGAHIIKNAIKVKRKSEEIRQILIDNQIDTVYLADFQNQTNRFSCVWLSKLGYKVIFYEEGYSHYIPRVGYPPSNNVLHKVYEKIIDWLYYQPLYRIDFAKWRCYVNKDYHGLPIYLRYSIIPGIHHEPYDKILTYKPMITPKLQSYIDEEVGDTEENKMLLLTDPMTEILATDYKFLYFETIKEQLLENKDYHLYIKFHPRDSIEDREHIIRIAEESGHTYTILGNRINIPVEFYLQNIVFSSVLFFNTSTFFYNGLLFPATRFVKLLPILYNKCKYRNIPDLVQMELILKSISKHALHAN